MCIRDSSYAVLALRFAAEVLPTLLAAATAYFAIGLLDTMEDLSLIHISRESI